MKGDRGQGDGQKGRRAAGFRAYLRHLHLGTQLALLLVLGVFGGIWLDGKLGWSPALTLVGAFLGIGLGMAVVIRDVNRKEP